MKTLAEHGAELREIAGRLMEFRRDVGDDVACLRAADALDAALAVLRGVEFAGGIDRYGHWIGSCPSCNWEVEDLDDGGIPYNEHRPRLQARRAHRGEGAGMSKWISVAERLPEPRIDVLVWMQPPDFPGFQFASVATWNGTEWEAWSTRIPAVDVTHWMPLPQPPK